MEWTGHFPPLGDGNVVDPLQYSQSIGATDPHPDGVESPLPALLSRLGNPKTTGSVTLEMESGESLNIDLIKGSIQSFESSALNHSSIMVGILTDLGQLSGEAGEALLEKCEALEQSAVRILVGQGDLRPREAVELIRSTFVTLMIHALSGTNGSIRFEAKSPDEVKPGPVPTPLMGTLIRGILTYIERENEAIGGNLDSALEACEVFLPKDSLPLLSKWGEMKTSELLPKPQEHQEPCAWTRLNEMAGKRAKPLLMTAFLTGQLKVTSFSGTVTPQVAVKVIPKLLTDLNQSDLYERLELHWTCHPDKIFPAFDSRMSQISYELEGDHLKQGEELLHEARIQLSTVEGRQAYRSKEYGDRLVRERATFMIDQVKRNILRKEWREGVMGLEAIMDMGIKTAEVLDLLDSANTHLR